jgi:riboflavin synthase
MFSGIIEELGTVRSLVKVGRVYKLQVMSVQIAPNVQPGQSICVNGVCLTVVKAEKNLLSFDIMSQTMRSTNLGLLLKDNKVNLERALRVNGRIDGHFVTGHIDGTGTLIRRQQISDDVEFEIKAPDQILPYIALKGSVALDGVSLTISGQENNKFRVSLIPYTLNNTTWGLKREADIVNIECDIIAKYIANLLSSKQHFPTSNINLSFLKKHGFIM